MKAALATLSEIAANNTLVNTLRASLTDHTARSFATAHQTLIAVPSTYKSSDDQVIADHVLRTEIDGLTLYVPCKVVIGEVPAS